MVLCLHGQNFRINVQVWECSNHAWLALGGMVIGEVVLENAIRGLVSWNPDSQKIKNLKINGFHNTFVGSYVESLVLLNKAADCVVTY